MNFVVIDVETANSAFSSICQVGVARFKEGMHIDSWETLVDPQEDFDFMNVSIHGIDENTVRGAPTWSDVYPTLLSWLTGTVVVSHTSFDRAALNAACAKRDIRLCDLIWLDTACVVRRAWPMFAKRGYGLGNVCAHFGIQFKHHDAAEDARAAGEILLRAISETGLNVEKWLVRVTQPIDLRPEPPEARAGDPEGPLFGETIVFTGALAISRHDAADLAARAGCDVGSNVTKHTTILVVGDQDIQRLAGHERSAKHRKAETLIASGQAIRIVGESDFRRLLSMNESVRQKSLERLAKVA